VLEWIKRDGALHCCGDFRGWLAQRRDLRRPCCLSRVRFVYCALGETESGPMTAASCGSDQKSSVPFQLSVYVPLLSWQTNL